MDNASAKELFILGRISLRSTYGHEIMHTLRESHADLWVELSEKHVYYILRKLDSKGFVTVTQERTGNLPERKVYTITDSGRTALAEMMVAENLVQAMAYSEFDVMLGMLSYSDALGDEAKSAVLLRRQDVLESQLEDLVEVTGDMAASGEASGFPRIIAERLTARLEDEIEWLQSIMVEVQHNGWSSMRPTFKPAQRLVD